jgi:hypothetical protein
MNPQILESLLYLVPPVFIVVAMAYVVYAETIGRKRRGSR